MSFIIFDDLSKTINFKWKFLFIRRKICFCVVFSESKSCLDIFYRIQFWKCLLTTCLRLRTMLWCDFLNHICFSSSIIWWLIFDIIMIVSLGKWLSVFFFSIIVIRDKLIKWIIQLLGLFNAIESISNIQLLVAFSSGYTNFPFGTKYHFIRVILKSSEFLIAIEVFFFRGTSE